MSISTKTIPFALSSVFLLGTYGCTSADERLAPSQGGGISTGGATSGMGGMGSMGGNQTDACDDAICQAPLQCVDQSGSIRCECPPGDSCETTTCEQAECDPNALCTDLPGGGFICACDAGYSGNGFECSFGDPCEGIVCSVENAECRVGDEDIFCQCRTGYESPLCEDIDECSANPAICGTGSVCQNFEGGYRCNCSSGYEWNGSSCIDIDECSRNLDACDNLSGICSNIDGIYTCECPAEEFGSGFFCTDTDNCAGDPCENGGTCTHTEQGYVCECPEGFGGQTCATDCTSVSFDDPNLESWVREILVKPSGAITQDDLNAFDALTIPASKAVASLEGLQCWTSLQSLTLEQTSITDLSPLEEMPKLRELSAQCNDWSNLDPVSNLYNLFELDVARSEVLCDLTPQYTSLAPLADLTLITNLNIGGHALSSLDGLENMKFLFSLVAADNQLTDIQALSAATALRDLNLQENKLTSVADLNSLINLRELNLSRNQFSSLDEFSTLNFLDSLDLSINLISSIEPISSLTRVGELSLSFNEIANISPLASLEQVVVLELNSNQLKNLQPLNDNLDFGQTGTLQISNNPLPCASQQELIDELEARGLTIFGTCQEL